MGQPLVHWVCPSCGEPCLCHEWDGVHVPCGGQPDPHREKLEEIRLRAWQGHGKEPAGASSNATRSARYVE